MGDVHRTEAAESPIHQTLHVQEKPGTIQVGELTPEAQAPAMPGRNAAIGAAPQLQVPQAVPTPSQTPYSIREIADKPILAPPAPGEFDTPGTPPAADVMGALREGSYDVASEMSSPFSIASTAAGAATAPGIAGINPLIRAGIETGVAIGSGGQALDIQKQINQLTTEANLATAAGNVGEAQLKHHQADTLRVQQLPLVAMGGGALAGLGAEVGASAVEGYRRAGAPPPETPSYSFEAPPAETPPAPPQLPEHATPAAAQPLLAEPPIDAQFVENGSTVPATTRRGPIQTPPPVESAQLPPAPPTAPQRGGQITAEFVDEGGAPVYEVTPSRPAPPKQLQAAPKQKALTGQRSSPWAIAAPTTPPSVTPQQRNVETSDGVMRAGPARAAGEQTVVPTRATKSQTMPVATDLRKLASEYNKNAGLPEPKYEQAIVNEAKSQEIADFYTAAESKPNNPAVRRAYSAFNAETDKQFEFLKKKGYKFEATSNSSPYTDAASLSKDLVDNKHLFVWTGGSPQHGLMTPDQNFRFRAVHDATHALGQGTFGHQGEETTYKTHKQMYSPLAQRAMATETRGQNAAVHFSTDLKNPPETIYRDTLAGDEGDLKFPEQKAIILPKDLIDFRKTSNPAEALVKGGGKEVAPKQLKTGRREGISFFIDEEGNVVMVGSHHSGLDNAGMMGPGDTDWSVDNPTGIQKILTENRLTRGWVNPDEISIELQHEPSFESLEALRQVAEANPRAKFVYDIGKRHGTGRYVDFARDVDKAYPGVATVDASRGGTGTSVGRAMATYRNTNEGPRIYLSQPTMRSFSRAIGYSGSAAMTINNVTPNVVTTITKRLQADKNISLSVSNEIIKSLQQALVDHPDKPSIAFVPLEPGMPISTVKVDARHERTHVQLQQAGFDTERAAVDFHPNVVRGLTARGYDVSNKRTLFHEALAHLASGSLRQNLELSHDEIVTELAKIGDAIVNQIGVEKALDVFRPMAPSVKEKALGEINARQYETGNITGPRGAGQFTVRGQQQPAVDSLLPGREEGSRGGVRQVDELRVDERKLPITKHLTASELEGKSDKSLAKIQDLFDQLPDTADFISAAKRGAVGKYWYDNSAKALAAPFGDDAPKFVALLAATSPQQPVKQNLKQALNIWKKWEDAGRPTNAPKIEALIREVDNLPARVPNSVRALTGEPLSGPKVDSFLNNLMGNVNHVTNDVWMSRFGGIAQNALGQELGYLSLTAKVRAAATKMGWTPQQVQAANWTWVKPVWEIAMKGTSVKEALKHVRPETAQGVADFARIFVEDADVRSKLESILKAKGTDLATVEAQLKAEGFPKSGRDETTHPPLTRRFTKQLQDSVTTASKPTVDARRESPFPLAEKRKSEAGMVRLFGPSQKPLPPDPKYDKILEDRAITAAGPTMLQRFSKAWNETRVKYDDVFKAIDDAVRDAAKRGVYGAAGDNPEKIVRLEFGGRGGFIEEVLSRYGDVAEAAGKLQVLPHVEKYLSLKSGYQRAWDTIRAKEAAARAAGDTKLAKEYAATLASGKVAPQSYSEAEINQALKELEASVTPAEWTKIKQWAGEVNAINREGLELFHDEGMIADTVYKDLVARGPEYINLSRIMDDIQTSSNLAGPASPLSVRKQTYMQSLEGSERSNRDAIVASAMHHVNAIRTVARNRVARTFITWATTTDPAGMGKLVKLQTPGVKVHPTEDTISFFRNGKPETWVVPESIGQALKESTPHDVRLIGDAILRFSRNLIQAGAITYNTAFMGVNVVRDVLDARKMLPGTKPYNPVDAAKFAALWARSLRSVIADDAVHRAYLRSGAANSNLQRMIAPEAFMPKLLQNQGEHSILRRVTIDPIQAVLNSLARVNDVAEQTTKQASWSMLTHLGLDPTDAAYYARKYGGSPDFFVRGTSTAQFSPLIPFFNAAKEGTKRNFQWVRSLAGLDPAHTDIQSRAKLAAILAGMGLTALGIEWWNSHFLNDDGMPESAHVSDNDNENYWYVFLPEKYQTSAGGQRWVGIKVAKSHLDKLIANPMQAVLMAITRGQRVNATQTAMDMVSNSVPGQIKLDAKRPLSSLVGGIIASVNPILSEPIEQIANRDTSENIPIVPERMTGLAPEYQYSSSTPKSFVEMGKMTGVSPVRIQHGFYRFFGGAGEQVTNIADAMLTAMQKTEGQDSPDEDMPGTTAAQVGERHPGQPALEGPEKLAKIPVIGTVLRRFLVSASDQVEREATSNLYDLDSKSAQYITTFNELGRRWLIAPGSKEFGEMAAPILKDPKKLAMLVGYGDIQKIVQVEAGLRKAIDAVQHSDLTDLTKKLRVRALYEARLRVIRDLPIVTDRVDAKGNAITEKYATVLDRIKGLDAKARRQILVDKADQIADKLGISALTQEPTEEDDADAQEEK